MPRCSRPPVPDTCLQPVLPATVEFDSAAAALRIFHTKSLERKSLVTPAQRVQPPFPLDSFACTPSIAPPPLPPAAATTGIRPARQQATVATPQESGKKGTHVYPTRAELYCRTPQDHSHCYKAEAELPYVIFFLIKLSWLEERDLGVLSTTHPDFEAMITSIPRLLKVDFTSLKTPVMDYASHTSIAPARVRMLTACAVHYDLDFGLVTRYLGGEYTAEWRDVNAIISTCEPFVTPKVLCQMERILTTGCPSYLNWEEDAANKRTFVSRRNLPSVAQHSDLVAKTLAKEVRNSHLIPMARWVCTCSPWGRHVPQNIQIKPKKKPRLIWDGSTRMFWDETSMNMATPMDLEMEITFGTAFTDLCIWIWNLRISYPDEDIFLAFLDISSCFRFPRIFPDLVGAFGFIVGPIFYAANAGVFGSVASASSWEPFRVAIAALATAYFFLPDLAAKHDWLLQKLRWSDAGSPPPSSMTIVRARPCTRHKGVFDSAGRRIPTKHNIYVDDNLLAEVKAHMHQALASGFEATFTIMGRPCPSLRPVAVNLDKLEELVVSPLQILLGLLVNTREMTVAISDEFRNETLELITTTWHHRRQSFTVKELELLVGKLGRIAQAYRPFYFLMSHLYSSLAFALRENRAFLVNTSKRFRALIKKTKQDMGHCVTADEREINFALSQSAKKVHSCPATYRIPPSLRAELEYIRRILADTGIPLHTPIAVIVPRDYEYAMWADSCKQSGGGWSTDMKFWWFLEYPTEIVGRATLANNKGGKYISINALEMVCVIVNYAAAIHVCWHDKIDLSHFPAILNWCDNTSACSWINTRCKESLIGRALGRFFCGMIMGTALSLDADYISTHANVIADDISRLKRSADGQYDHSKLLTDHPLLCSCRTFQPSKSLLTTLWDIMLNSASPDPLTIRQLRPETLGSFISSPI